MTANRRRGEIAAELDGKAYRLCLTLGALAELEAAYAADDLGALVERFSRGRLSALDMIRVIGAGLARRRQRRFRRRGAVRCSSEDGAAGFARCCQRSSDHDLRRGAPEAQPPNP